MKRSRLMAMALAGIAALGAAMLANSMLSGPQVVERVVKEKAIQVLVAGNAIRLGDTVNAGDMRWQDWPESAPTAGYITKARKPKAVSEYAGAIARAAFLPGEPIKPRKLIKKSEGGVMAAILPRGMRAISVKISEETAAGGFILPNDRVDVILTRRLSRGKGNSDGHVSDTLFRNTRVLAIGQHIETTGNKKAIQGRTATLELSPRQAEILALAQSMGEISLSLRSLADSGQGKGGKGKDDPFGERGGSVKVIKYGMASRAYGIE